MPHHPSHCCLQLLLVLLLQVQLLPVGGVTAEAGQGRGSQHRVRLLLLTGKSAKDGHHRLFRAATGAGYLTQMLVVEESRQEVSKVLQVIRKERYASDDLLVLTNSDEYIPTCEPGMLILRVLGHLLQEEAEVVMSYPPRPHNLTLHLKEEFKRVNNELKFRLNSTGGHVTGKEHRTEDLLTLKKLLHEQQVLKVREQQQLRRAPPDTQNFTAYAFAGLVRSLEDLLAAAAGDAAGPAGGVPLGTAIATPTGTFDVTTATASHTVAAAATTTTTILLLLLLLLQLLTMRLTMLLSLKQLLLLSWLLLLLELLLLVSLLQLQLLALLLTRQLLRLLPILRQRDKGSLAHIWDLLARDVVLRHSLAVTLDHHSPSSRTLPASNQTSWRRNYWEEKFNNLSFLLLSTFRNVEEWSKSAREPKSGVAPLVYSTSGAPPLHLHNMMAREVGLKLSCPQCLDEPRKLANITMMESPRVMVVVVVERPVPYLRVFLSRLKRLSYPKHRIFLVIHVTQQAHQHLQQVEEFLEVVVEQYLEVVLLTPQQNTTLTDARHLIWKLVRKENLDYLFLLEANAHLTHPDLLQHLIATRRRVVGPLLVTDDGSTNNLQRTQQETDNLVDDTHHKFLTGYTSNDGSVDMRGLLQVGAVRCALLLHREAYSSLRINFTSYGLDPTEEFFTQLLKQGYIPYVSNKVTYGKLVNEKSYTNDLWNLDKNSEEFLYQYMDPSPGNSGTPHPVCPHLRTLKVFTRSFARDLLLEAQTMAWNNASDQEGIQVLAPPTSAPKEAINVLVQSTIRSLFRHENIQVAESGGRVQLVHGPGQYIPEGQLVALVALRAKNQGDQVELGSTPCTLQLRVGEVLYYKIGHYPMVTLTGSLSLAALLL
nr:LOW QUALITY PROTEIN: uncharacterized protein LOC128688486 [Cherax quadricarinatus]